MDSRLPVLLMVMIVIQGSKVCAQQSETAARAPMTALDSVMAEYRRHPPKAFQIILMERKSARLRLQRTSYAQVLTDALHHDGISAMFSYLKMNIQLEFSLDHGFLFWIVPPDPVMGVPGIPFEEDLSFPTDPWEAK
ncbi:MAG TPA: hypothetical protein VL633_02920 [Bacteroidota bacterium]|nr:hypothetical protein [Bacteroidota bacterium]